MAGRDGRASLVRAGREALVAVSGGVELDGWAAVESVRRDAALAETGKRILGARKKGWVWDGGGQ